MKVINLFENFGQKDLDLAKSLYMADIKHPTVVMNYSGFLPPEAESPFEYYIDQNSDGKAGVLFQSDKTPRFMGS